MNGGKCYKFGLNCHLQWVLLMKLLLKFINQELSPRNCTILLIDIIMLFMRRLSLIIRVSYDTLNVDSQGIRMTPNSMPFYLIFPEEKYLSLMTVCYLPIKYMYIQIAILSSRHLQRNRYIDKIR